MTNADKNPGSYLFSLLLVAAANAMPAISAMAADGGGSTALEEIVVTARKRAESSQKVPEAISSLTSRQIEQSFQNAGPGLEGASPNLVFDRVVAGPGGGALSIRGISFQDIEKSFDPAVGVALDGIYLGTNTGQVFQIFDFDRIEVLRGPQGTLFGKNTIGGMINIIRKEPTGAWGGKVRVRGGSRDLHDVDAILNVPLVSDVFAAKFDFTSRRQEGPYRNLFLGNKRVGGTDYKSYGATFKYTPTDKIKVLYTYQREDDNSPIGALINISLPTDLLCFAVGQCAKDASGVVPQSGDPLTVNQNGSDAQFYKLHAHTLNAQWELAEGYRLDYVFGVRQSDEQTHQDFDATPIPFYETVRTQNFKQTSNELRFTYDRGGAFNLVTGLYSWKSHYFLHQDTLFGGLPNAITQDTSHESKSWALFAQSDIKFTDQWIFTLGGRYTKERKELQSQEVFFPGFGIDFNTFPTPAKAEWSKFTPKAGLRWQFTPEQMAYVSYSTGFRSGGFNGRGATLAAVTDPYNPEKVNSAEIGYKSQWLNDRLRFNIDVFTSKYKDKQEEIVTPVGASNQTLVKNASQAKINGVEVELSAVPIDGLTLQFSGGYLDAKYDSFCASLTPPLTLPSAPGQCAPATLDPTSGGYIVPTDNSSLKLRRAPKYTFSFDTTYTHPLGRGDFTGNAAVRYKSEYYTSFQSVPAGLTDAAAIVDGSLSYDIDHWRFSVYGHNLTDKVVRNSALLVAGLFSFAASTLPREYGAEVQFKFGKTD
jgi:iron complex outermembrane receptor protein